MYLLVCKWPLQYIIMSLSSPLQDAELESSQPLEKVSIDDILEAQRVQQEEREKEKKKRENILRARGMRPLDQGEDTYA